MRKRPLAPTRCLDENPTSKSIRLGGRFINLTRLSEYGMDHGYLSYIFSGDRVPSIPYGRKIAKLLGILTEEGEPNLEGLLTLIRERRLGMDKDHQQRLHKS